MFQLILIATIDLFFIYVYRDLRLASFVTNICSHSILSFMSIYVYLTSTVEYNDVFATGSSEVFCAEWMFWYLCYDTGKLLMGVYDNNSKLYYVHHILAMLLLDLIIRFEFLHHYLPVICMFEISSIPLNIRYALRYLDISDKNSIVDVVFVMSFVMVRWCFGFYKGVQALYVINTLEHEHVAATFVVNVLLFVFFVIHVYWTILVFLKFKKSMWDKQTPNLNKHQT
jgi:hypothetical protein